MSENSLFCLVTHSVDKNLDSVLIEKISLWRKWQAIGRFLDYVHFAIPSIFGQLKCSVWEERRGAFPVRRLINFDFKRVDGYPFPRLNCRAGITTFTPQIQLEARVFCQTWTCGSPRDSYPLRKTLQWCSQDDATLNMSASFLANSGLLRAEFEILPFLIIKAFFTKHTSRTSISAYLQYKYTLLSV